MARVLFDSAHNEYLKLGKWGSQYLDVLPERFDWQELAISVAKCGYEIANIDSGILPADLKNYCDILVIADPESCFFHSWQINPNKNDRGVLLQAEIDNILNFVKEGGSLFVIQEKYGDSRRKNNLNALVKNFGVQFYDETIESENCYQKTSKWVILDNFQTDHEIAEGLQKIIFFEGCSMKIDKNSNLTAIAYTDRTAHPHANAPAIVAGNYEKGKIVCMGDATIFTEQGLGEMCDNSESHFRLLWNILRWLTPIKGLSDNLITTGTSDILLPIAINKIVRIESRNQTIDEIKTIQKTNSESVEKKLETLSKEVQEIKNSIEQSNGDNRLGKFLDIISNIVLMFSALSLAYILGNEFEQSSKIVITLFCVGFTALSVLTKIFWIPIKKS
jgi:hypothetical protein